MEISCGDIRSPLLYQPSPPSIPSQVLRRFSYSFAPTTYHIPLRTSILSLTPNFLFNSSCKALTTTRSLPDDAVPVLIQKKAVDVSPELKGTSIFLVGINSSMKTSLGKLLADALGYYYFDSDNLVEEAAGGESAGKSFRDRDKEGFCELETEVLKELSSMGRLVVCAGNGAVQCAANLALLRDGLSLWVDVPLDMVARDVIENRSKLLPSEIITCASYSEVFNQLTVLYEEMRGGYATADATISVDSIYPMTFFWLIVYVGIFFPLTSYSCLLFSEVALKLGFDDLDAVTQEDMALEALKEMEKLIRVKKMMEEAARPF